MKPHVSEENGGTNQRAIYQLLRSEVGKATERVYLVSPASEILGAGHPVGRSLRAIARINLDSQPYLPPWILMLHYLVALAPHHCGH